jgi:putative oxidoreductase
MSLRGLLTANAPARLTDSAFVILRLAAAVVFVAHGWNTFSSQGVSGAIAAQQAAGIPLPALAGPFTVFGELVGGILLALGLLTRLSAIAISVIMLGAWVFVHAQNGLFASKGGFEYVMILAAISLTLIVTGPGRYSIDHLLAGNRHQPEVKVAGSSLV